MHSESRVSSVSSSTSTQWANSILSSVWVHTTDFAKLDLDEFQQAKKDGPSLADGLRRALQDAARKMEALPQIPGHPKVAKCDASTGTAKARIVTPQDFVQGRALDF